VPNMLPIRKFDRPPHRIQVNGQPSGFTHPHPTTAMTGGTRRSVRPCLVFLLPPIKARANTPLTHMTRPPTASSNSAAGQGVCDSFGGQSAEGGQDELPRSGPLGAFGTIHPDPLRPPTSCRHCHAPQAKRQPPHAVCLRHPTGYNGANWRTSCATRRQCCLSYGRSWVARPIAWPASTDIPARARKTPAPTASRSRAAVHMSATTTPALPPYAAPNRMGCPIWAPAWTAQDSPMRA
jgi:hypothetical protein